MAVTTWMREYTGNLHSFPFAMELKPFLLQWKILLFQRLWLLGRELLALLRSIQMIWSEESREKKSCKY